jgi:outer membrane protein TolC
MRTLEGIFMRSLCLLVCLSLGDFERLPAAAPEQLDLRALIAEALRRNPEIVAAQKRYEAAGRRPSVAGSLPDPMLSLGYQSAGHPLPGAGLGREPTANAGFMLSQQIPSPGKRKLRGQVASKEAEAAFQEFEQVQLGVVSKVKQAYHKLHHAYAMLELLERNLETLEKLLRITETRYSVGRAEQQDIFQAQTEISVLTTRRLQLESDKRVQEAAINALLARHPGTPSGRPQEPTALGLTATLENLLDAAARQAPALMRNQKMIERGELAVNLARKDYYPDYTVNAGYFNMGSMPDMYQVRVDVNLPLWHWRKQRNGVREQVMLLDEARRNYEASSRAIEGRVQEDYLMAQTSFRLMRIYSNTIVKQADLTLESSLRSYETGAVDFLTVLKNFVSRIEYEMNFHEQQMNYHLALARLEEMTGVALPDSGGKP